MLYYIGIGHQAIPRTFTQEQFRRSVEGDTEATARALKDYWQGPLYLSRTIDSMTPRATKMDRADGLIPQPIVCEPVPEPEQDSRESVPHDPSFPLSGCGLIIERACRGIIQIVQRPRGW